MILQFCPNISNGIPPTARPMLIFPSLPHHSQLVPVIWPAESCPALWSITFIQTPAPHLAMCQIIIQSILPWISCKHPAHSVTWTWNIFITGPTTDLSSWWISPGWGMTGGEAWDWQIVRLEPQLNNRKVSLTNTHQHLYTQEEGGGAGK